MANHPHNLETLRDYEGSSAQNTGFETMPGESPRWHFSSEHPSCQAGENLPEETANLKRSSDLTTKDLAPRTPDSRPCRAKVQDGTSHPSIRPVRLARTFLRRQPI